MSPESKNEEDDSITPPTYRVEENKSGELINPKLNVAFPQRPKKGHYSVACYLRAKKRLAKRLARCSNRQLHDDQEKGDGVSVDQLGSNRRESDKCYYGGRNASCHCDKKKQCKSSDGESRRSEGRCRCTCGGCCRHLPGFRAHLTRKNLRDDEKAKKTLLRCDRKAREGRRTEAKTSDINVESRPIMPVADNLKSTIAGPQTEKQIEKMLMPTQFLLYYHRIENIKSLDNVPINEPLTIAYKSNASHVFHYRIKYERNEDGVKMWHVELGTNAPEQPRFYLLDKLIQYYKVFALTTADNNIEFFHTG